MKLIDWNLTKNEEDNYTKTMQVKKLLVIPN